MLLAGPDMTQMRVFAGVAMWQRQLDWKTEMYLIVRNYEIWLSDVRFSGHPKEYGVVSNLP